MFLRLDVDFPSFSRLWSYFRLVTGSPIPNFLDHVKATKTFLEENYPDVETLWMFRPETSPDNWKGKFGLHSCGPDKFSEEYYAVTKKLGKFRFFNTHGDAPFRAGKLVWTRHEIEIVEKNFDVVCLNKYPFSSIDFDFLSFKFWLSRYGLKGLHHINFHPCHLRSHKQNLVEALKLMETTK